MFCPRAITIFDYGVMQMRRPSTDDHANPRAAGSAQETSMLRTAALWCLAMLLAGCATQGGLPSGISNGTGVGAQTGIADKNSTAQPTAALAAEPKAANEQASGLSATGPEAVQATPAPPTAVPPTEPDFVTVAPSAAWLSALQARTALPPPSTPPPNFGGITIHDGVLSPRPPIPPPSSSAAGPPRPTAPVIDVPTPLVTAQAPPSAAVASPSARLTKRNSKRSGKNGQYDVVRVFFGTDRAVDHHSATPAFTTQRAQSLTFGSVDVSIPPHHVTGVVETPSLWKLEFHRDPTRDVTILQVAVTSYAQFQAEMRSRALNATTPSVLLFIHGYNVNFEDAAMRTAQMAHDLQFAGAPVFFSWPSRGNLIGYFDDETAIERSQDDIEHFVTQVLAATPGANLYVIAHSMGNRGMTRALVSFAHDHPDEAGRIREVILAAPDIDTDVFVNQIAPNLVAIGAPVTLYASSTDHALRISEAIHGGPRAGDSGKSMVLLRGIETIDVTNVDTDLTGHSYVDDQRTILSDLYYIVRSDTRAGDRFGLTRQVRNGSEYWVFNR
jgi:esterase/lipase superfamily enzyme